ncbi:MAG: hypothetical protein RLZZ450_5492 [Pseudomonadota bacterium]|jgi:serine/threonine protein kinase
MLAEGWQAGARAGNPPPVLLEPGTELENGKYRIVQLLGSGGMGSVYEAEHTRSKKRVAIKWMHPSWRDAENAKKRMEREAEAAARVRHPNIVNVFDVVRDETTVFLVMEYLEGETLKAALARRDLPIHAVIALLVAGMRGVAEAHKAGVIHRDIKPENIFLAREVDTPLPVTKVLDFGVSKLDTGDDLSALTVAGAPIGTTSYMSFEQLSGHSDIDGRADVYSFGVVLYEALTGQRPYEGNFAEVLCKMLEGPPREPAQLNPELPPTLSRLVMWALERERDARIPSMKQLVQELEPFSTLHGYQTELSSGAAQRVPLALAATESQGVQRGGWESPLASRPVASAVGPREKRRAWAATGVAGVAVTLLAAFSLWFTLRGNEPRAPSLPAKMTMASSAASQLQAVDASRASTSSTLSSQGAPLPALPAPPPEARTDEAAHVQTDAASGERSRQPRAKTSVSSTPPAARVPGVVGHPSAGLEAAQARSQAELERLTEQLVKCGELHASWLREQCRDKHAREIAAYKEARETVKSVSGP